MKRFSCCLLLGLAASGAAHAQTRPVPGLWEHSTEINTGSSEMGAAMAKMQEQLAAMPPEQRKQMAAAMGRQGMGMGMGMSAAPGQGMIFKVCLTP